MLDIKRVKTFYKKFKSATGMALAEVMLAAGLLGGLSLVVVRLMENAAVSQKHTEQNYGMTEIQKEIEQVLANKDSCTKTLFGKGVGDQVNSLFLVDKTGVQKTLSNLSPGRKIAGMEIKSYSIKNITPMSSGAKGELLVQLDRKGGLRKGEVNSRIISFSAQVDANNKIAECYSLYSNQAAIAETCTKIGGTIDPATDKCFLNGDEVVIDDAGNPISLKDYVDKLIKKNSNPFGDKECEWNGWSYPVPGQPTYACSGNKVGDVDFSPYIAGNCFIPGKNANQYGDNFILRLSVDKMGLAKLEIPSTYRFNQNGQFDEVSTSWQLLWRGTSSGELKPVPKFNINGGHCNGGGNCSEDVHMNFVKIDYNTSKGEYCIILDATSFYNYHQANGGGAGNYSINYQCCAGSFSHPPAY